jgi:flagellar basal-body rod protein FlgF
MDALTAAAASGMRARIESLDMLANNLANSSTAGFKTDREAYSLYLSSEAAESPEGTNPAILPVIQSRWTDFTQGAIHPTGNPTDLALDGRGFFVVSSTSGPIYTRDGNFRLSRQGQLQTQAGDAVQDSSGSPIVLDSSKSFEVTAQGSVRQDAQEVARIAVVDFMDPAALAKRGGNYFQSNLSRNSPTAAMQAEVQQGKIEAANSESARSAAGLVSILRQFEALQKAMAVGADMNRRAVEEVAKVSP